MYCYTYIVKRLLVWEDILHSIRLTDVQGARHVRGADKLLLSTYNPRSERDSFVGKSLEKKFNRLVIKRCKLVGAGGNVCVNASLFKSCFLVYPTSWGHHCLFGVVINCNFMSRLLFACLNINAHDCVYRGYLISLQSFTFVIHASRNKIAQWPRNAGPRPENKDQERSEDP